MRLHNQSRWDGKCKLQSKAVKRLWIIFLASIVWAAFSKVQGVGFKEYSMFPFSSLKMIWPIYFWNICINIVPIAYIWTLWTQETERPKELKWIALVITGKLFDFMLECNQARFSIGWYAVSYDTLIFGCISLILLRAYIYG